MTGLDVLIGEAYALADDDADWRFAELRASVERLWIDGELADADRLAAIDRIAEAQQRRAMRAEIDHAATGPHAADLELFGDRDAQADAWVRAGFTPVEAGAWLCAGVLDAGVASHLRSIEVMACSPLLQDELHHGATWARALSVTRELSVADFEAAWREA